MIESSYYIEHDDRRATFYPRKDGQISVCLLDVKKEIHKHRIFKDMLFAKTMAKNWCLMSKSITNLRAVG
jgi:hypothetical protein